VTKDFYLDAIQKFNLCASLSTIGKHEKAIKYAQDGIIILQKYCFPSEKELLNFGGQKVNHHFENRSMAMYIETLSKGFYNLGVELEHLHQYDK